MLMSFPVFAGCLSVKAISHVWWSAPTSTMRMSTLALCRWGRSFGFFLINLFIRHIIFTFTDICKSEYRRKCYGFGVWRVESINHLFSYTVYKHLLVFLIYVCMHYITYGWSITLILASLLSDFFGSTNEVVNTKIKPASSKISRLYSLLHCVPSERGFLYCLNYRWEGEQTCLLQMYQWLIDTCTLAWNTHFSSSFLLPAESSSIVFSARSKVPWSREMLFILYTYSAL